MEKNMHLLTDIYRLGGLQSSGMWCSVTRWMGPHVSKVKFPSSSRVYGYSSWTLNPWQESDTFLWSISNPRPTTQWYIPIDKVLISLL
jgi:hypothetical protein